MTEDFFVRSTFDRSRLLEALDILSDLVYRDVDFGGSLKKYAYPALFKYMSDKGVTRDNFLDVSRSLVEKVKDLKEVRVILAFEPDEKMRNFILDYVLSRLPAGHIVDLVVDPSILGGLVIERGGKIHDYSLRSRVEEGLRDVLRKDI